MRQTSDELCLGIQEAAEPTTSAGASVRALSLSWALGGTATARACGAACQPEPTVPARGGRRQEAGVAIPRVPGAFNTARCRSPSASCTTPSGPMRLPPRLRLRSTLLEQSDLPSAPAPASPSSLKRRLSSMRPQLVRARAGVGVKLRAGARARVEARARTGERGISLSSARLARVRLEWLTARLPSCCGDLLVVVGMRRSGLGHGSRHVALS